MVEMVVCVFVGCDYKFMVVCFLFYLFFDRVVWVCVVVVVFVKIEGDFYVSYRCIIQVCDDIYMKSFEDGEVIY